VSDLTSGGRLNRLAVCVLFSLYRRVYHTPSIINKAPRSLTYY